MIGYSNMRRDIIFNPEINQYYFSTIQLRQALTITEINAVFKLTHTYKIIFFGKSFNDIPMFFFSLNESSTPATNDISAVFKTLNII